MPRISWGLKGNLKLVAWNDDGWGNASTLSSRMLDLIRDCFVYLILSREWNVKFKFVV